MRDGLWDGSAQQPPASLLGSAQDGRLGRGDSARGSRALAGREGAARLPRRKELSPSKWVRVIEEAARPGLRSWLRSLRRRPQGPRLASDGSGCALGWADRLRAPARLWRLRGASPVGTERALTTVRKDPLSAAATGEDPRGTRGDANQPGITGGIPARGHKAGDDAKTCTGMGLGPLAGGLPLSLSLVPMPRGGPCSAHAGPWGRELDPSSPFPAGPLRSTL